MKFNAPRSPSRGHTIEQLRRLRESNYHNPDTGTELDPGEADAHLSQLEERRAAKKSAEIINRALRQRTRSRGRPMISGDQVQFRMIHGHRVPFKRVSEPFL